MSAENFGFKALNGLVLVGLCVAGYFILVAPKHIPPPDDPWFQKMVVRQPNLVLVKFGADWCGPCRMMEPELDKLHGPFSVVRVNVDHRPNLAEHYGISSIPRVLLFRDGQIVADRVGYADHQHLQSWIASYAKK